MASKPAVRKLAAVAAVSLGVIAAALYLGRNVIAASVLRSTGSRLLGVPVDVRSVELDLFGLAVGIDGLRVANPEGWGAPTALEVRRVDVAVDPGSTPTNLAVERIALDGVSIWFITEGTGTNISAIVDGMEGAPAGKDGAKPGGSTALNIRLLSMADVQVHLGERGKAAADAPVVARIARLEVKDIGSSTTGTGLAQQLVGQVFEAVVLAIARDGAANLPRAVGGALQDSIREGGRLGGAAVEVLGGAAKGATDAVGGFFKGVGDALSGGKKPGG